MKALSIAETAHIVYLLEEGLSGRESLMLELDSIPDAHQVEAIMLLAKFPSLVFRD